VRRSRKDQRPGAGGRAAHAAPRAAAGPGTAAAPRQTPAEIVSIAALAALGAALYGRGFSVGLVGDDYTLLDAALRVPLLDLLSGRHGILGYYRPVSRELYFWWWGRVCGFHATGFHLVNALTYGAAVAMLFAFARRWLGWRAGVLVAAVFVLFPPGGALLSWVSCAQDLIALFWATAALLLYQRGRPGLSGIAVALAVLSKETAAILPFAIAVLEWSAGVAARPRARWKRLMPVFAGLAAAVAIAIGARLAWPPGTSVAIWSPRQVAGAWRLPLDFLRTLWPPDVPTGIATALGQSSTVLALAAAFAALAAPHGGPERAMRATPGRALAPQGRAVAEPDRAIPGRAAAEPDQAIRERAAAEPDRAIRERAPGSATRGAIVFGAAMVLLGMLPVGVIVERWRGYFFSFSALGSSLLAGMLLARLPSWPASLLLAAGAVLNYGSNSTYRPVEAAWAPARHPHVNYTFFRQTAEISDQLVQALAPYCASLASAPRTFTAGVPRQTVFENALGPALRVTCRDTVSRLRPLGDFTVDDAPRDFGVLRFYPQGMRFTHQRADAEVRAALGEGFLLLQRYEVAAACLDAAAGERPDDPEVSYPFVSSLAAAGRGAEAQAEWARARARGFAPSPDTLAARLLARATVAPSEPDRAATRRLAAAVLADPADAAAHAALGRHLLALGTSRQAAMELSVACGIGRRPEDLFWLARGYETMGAVDEARATYRRAIAAGLPPAQRAEAEERMRAIAEIPTIGAE
jgi:tetratricopeptide (TPR) repeat protein